MNTTAPARLRSPVMRVAVMAAGIVAIGYLVVALVVLVAVHRTLTAQVDQRLQSALARITGNEPQVQAPNFTPPSGVGPRFGPALLLWDVRSSDGAVLMSSVDADLPPSYRTVTEPTTMSIDGNDIRVAGTDFAGTHLVIGQTLDAVQRAEQSLIGTELIIAPVLVGLVFVGALMVGRRVADPIERARIRQMEFTADASHELRTPLSVIEAQTSLALSTDHPKAWYKDAFTRVDTENKRIRHLVEDMLWLARFDASQRQPEHELVDVAVLAEQAVDRFSAIAEARSLSLKLETTGDAPAISTTPDWLDRLAGVLLDNACRYTPEGGTVLVRVDSTGPRVRLAVEDSGPGIPADERERIFDRFHRATEQPGGAGLGLAIANAVVQASGGRWEIGDSELGGVAMAVSWPRNAPR